MSNETNNFFQKNKKLLSDLLELGIVAAFAWTFTVSFVVFKLIDMVIPLRVDGSMEEAGLDLHEHDAEAYPEFTSITGLEV